MFSVVKDYRNNKIVFEDINNIINKRKYWKKLNNKKILITGACGSIARYFVYTLVELNLNHNFKIDIFANARDYKKIEYFFGDYLQYDFFHYIIKDFSIGYDNEVQFDYIIHAASNARPELFYSKPVETITSNVVATENLLKNNKNCSCFLFLSTGSVYGKFNDNKLTENVVGIIDFNKVISSYSESKRVGELLCQSYKHEYGTNVKIARISHTFGPTLDLNVDERAFGQFFKNAILNKNIELRSSGIVKRAFLYISDAILAFFDIMLSDNDEIVYNVCGTNFISIYDFASLIANYANVNLMLNPQDHIQDSNANLSIPPCNELLKKIGWKDSISIKEAIGLTFQGLKIEQERKNN